MITSSVNLIRHPDGSFEVTIDGETRGRYRDADTMGLHLGMLILQMDVIRNSMRHLQCEIDGTVAQLQIDCGEDP